MALARDFKFYTLVGHVKYKPQISGANLVHSLGERSKKNLFLGTKQLNIE